MPACAWINYSTQRRNQYRGPHYFDMDLNLFKNFKVAERFNLAIGAAGLQCIQPSELWSAERNLLQQFARRRARVGCSAGSDVRNDQYDAGNANQPVRKLPRLRLISARDAAQREDRVLIRDFGRDPVFRTSGEAETESRPTARSASFFVAESRSLGARKIT